MDLTFQKELASRILKCGKSRVYIDPKALDDVSEAITREDIRMLIKKGVIRKLPKKGNSRSRIRKKQEQKKKGLRTGPGSRKGTKYARLGRKERWIKTIRAVRDELRKLKNEGKIDRKTYRRYYLYAKGGMFRSRAHLLLHLKGVLK
ncbi:MAG: 50S ribosomal protein L19e [Thermoplasmata archaeon]|jgi:large subunit ribosomal protein L19e|nr:50S ribosomal protein L19e [Thermoplasmatales archaeon]